MGSLAVLLSAVSLLISQGTTVIVVEPDLRPSQLAARDLEAEVELTAAPAEAPGAAGEPADESAPAPPPVQVPNLAPWVLGFPTAPAPAPATTIGVQPDTIGVQSPADIGAR